MAITITTAEVKHKAAIAEADTSRDTAVSALITEMQGPLEHSIAESCLEDPSLQATLKLGMLEIIAGEFLEQMRREVGATEEFSTAGVSVGASAVRGIELVQQGAARLAPYLKCALPMMSKTASSSTTLNIDPVFSREEEVW